MHDELKWIDVQKHAVKILNAIERVVFLTFGELMTATNVVDEAKSGGYRIITIPKNLKEQIRGLKDISGNTIRGLKEFYSEYEKSFEFKFIEPHQLTKNEKIIFDMTDKIFFLIGGKPKIIKHVKISETMIKRIGSFTETKGLWDLKTKSIIIKRDQLKSIEKYARTLLHEAAHTVSGASDITREFELMLTKLLGKIVKQTL